MTFWIGVSLGFGIGSVIVAAVMIAVIGKAMRSKDTLNEELIAYWKLSLQQQAAQVGMLGRIAKCLETKLIMED